MSNYKIRKCNAAEINAIVKRIQYYSQFYSKDYITTLINHSVDSKATEVINLYDIQDCIDIIISNGDILDAIKKNGDNEINMDDKLKFHQQLALTYIRELIYIKVNQKLHI